MNRRTFLTKVASGALATATARISEAFPSGIVAAGTPKVVLPTLSMPWPNATQIVGDRGQLSKEETERWRNNPKGFVASGALGMVYNDFCLIQDRTGRWHCIGIFHNVSQRELGDGLFHFVSDRPDGPYHRLEPIARTCWLGDARYDMWAPGAIWKDEQTAFMFYGHMTFRRKDLSLLGSSIRVLESSDPKLEFWMPKLDENNERQIALFHEKGSRDPEVLWDRRRKLYLMYYAADREQMGAAIRVRSSPDLLNWSAPITLMNPPPSYQAAESPYVLEKDGLFYLWVSGFDYGRMSLYVSEDPMDFGDPVDNRIMEQSGHAAQIIHANGEFWMACSAIASGVGNPPAMHDLPGIYIQRLTWAEADGVALEKISRQRPRIHG